MYSYINGTLEYIGNDYIVVDVNGIGYKIFTAVSNIKTVNVKDRIKVYTYLHVREDVLALYGFLTNEELDMFELCISVSGIGPKAAISLLSSLSPSKFALSLVTNDIDSITQAQGIGKKTAQRMILELKDKIKNDQLIDNDSVSCQINDNECEAINALVVLGYSKYEASKAVNSVNQNSDVETIVKDALKKLVKF